jgi:dihydrofolate reductase
MRRVIIDNLLSLDGYFAGPDGEIDWFQFDEESLEWSREILREVDTVLFGRVTYEVLASYWPTAAAMAEEPFIARRLTEVRKFVFSKTLPTASWINSTVVSDPPVEFVSKLKEEPGAAIVVLGSSTVVSALVRAGLVDDYKIRVQPMILGKGRPLFLGQDQRRALTLVSSTPFKSGVVALHYKPA